MSDRLRRSSTNRPAQTRIRNVLRPSPAVLLLAATLAGCGWWSGGDSTGAGAVAPDLECTRLDYPCTEAEVAQEVDREGVRLANEALDRFPENDGAATLEWLRGQPGVVHAVGDARGIRFRLEGGRPVWAIGLHRTEVGPAPLGATPRALTPLADSGSALPKRSDTRSPAISHSRSIWSRSPSAWWQSVPSLVPVVHAEAVGRDRDEDGHITDRDRRFALILDPFYWEWSRNGTRNEYQEGLAITRMLQAAPGFREGGVDYRRDGNANEDEFKTWHNYDVVHFAGHGHQTCEPDGPCYTVLFTGETRPLDQIDDPADTARETGIMGYIDANGVEVRQRHVGLGSDWFLSEYQGKPRLERTLVFVNGCGTVDPSGNGFVPDFLASMVAEGDATTVIGWDDTVPVVHAQTVALEIYRTMILDGLRAGDVIDSLPPSDVNVVNSEGRTARLRAGSGSGGSLDRARLRIREVISLFEPAGSASPLPPSGQASAGAGAPLVDGLQPEDVLKGMAGDEVDETLNVDLKVEGILPEQRHRAFVHLSVDDNPIRVAVPLAAENQAGNYAYKVPLRDSSLVEDLAPDRRYALMAEVDLPEGEQSIAKIEIELPSCYWTADMSGLIGGRIRGTLIGLRETRGFPTVGLNFHRLRDINRAGTINDPEGLTFAFTGPVREGEFSLGGIGLITLWARTFALSVAETGTLRLITVTPREQGNGFEEVAGEFDLQFEGLIVHPEVQGIITTQPGPISVQGEFSWKPGCIDSTDAPGPFLRDELIEPGMEGLIPGGPSSGSQGPPPAGNGGTPGV